MSHNVVELSKLTILMSSPDTPGMDGAVTRTKECLMTQVYLVRFTVPAEQFNRVLCACFRASRFDTWYQTDRCRLHVCARTVCGI